MRFHNGQACWVDVMVKDLGVQTEMTGFLTALFGLRWEIGGPETGFYAMGFVGNDQVMAVGQNEHGAGVPVVYLHADDIALSAAAVTAAGGQVIVGPMQVMDAGTMALCVDPLGAVFGMWQGNTMPGFGIDDVPGAFCWFDQMSDDPERSAAFYCEVFGLDSVPMGGGGILAAGEQWLASNSKAPAGESASWNAIFFVIDVDETEVRARSLGCEILMSRMPVPGGVASAALHAVSGLAVTWFQSVPAA